MSGQDVHEYKEICHDKTVLDRRIAVERTNRCHTPICGHRGELSLHVVALFPSKLELSSDSEHTDDFPEFHQVTIRNAGDLKTCKP